MHEDRVVVFDRHELAVSRIHLMPQDPRPMTTQRYSKGVRDHLEGTAQSLGRRGSQADAGATVMLEVCAVDAFRSRAHDVTWHIWLHIPAYTFSCLLSFVMNTTHNCCSIKLL